MFEEEIFMPGNNFIFYFRHFNLLNFFLINCLNIFRKYYYKKCKKYINFNYTKLKMYLVKKDVLRTILFFSLLG